MSGLTRRAFFGFAAAAPAAALLPSAVDAARARTHSINLALSAESIAEVQAAISDAGLRAFNDAIAPDLIRLQAAARRLAQPGLTFELGEPPLDRVDPSGQGVHALGERAEIEAGLGDAFDRLRDDAHAFVEALDLEAAGRLGHANSPAGCVAPPSIGTAGAGVKPAPARRRTAHPDEAA